jgi:hypothetical protein
LPTFSPTTIHPQGHVFSPTTSLPNGTINCDFQKGFSKEFLNSLKELMFVVNRGVVLSFPIVDLDQIDDGCEKNVLVGP